MNDNEEEKMNESLLVKYESRKQQAVSGTEKVREPVRKRQSEGFQANQGLGRKKKEKEKIMTKIMLNQKKSLC